MTEGDGSSRNFRSAYYEKLGFCGNDEKNYLDLLITSCPFDQDGLNNLCERFELDRKCIEAWKVLLGVECGRKNPFDDYANVRRVRSEHFQMLKHHLEVLLRHNLIIRNRSDSSKKENNSSELRGLISHDINRDHPQENANLITLMYLLETGQLDTLNIDSQLKSGECRKLIVIATFFVNVSDNLQEAFFLFRNFTNHIHSKPNPQTQMNALI